MPDARYGVDGIIAKTAPEKRNETLRATSTRDFDR